MVAGKQAVGGVDPLDEATGQQVSLKDSVFAVADKEIDICSAQLLQLFGGEVEGAALGADIIHDQNILAADVINISRHIQTQNLAGFPVPLFNAEGIGPFKNPITAIASSNTAPTASGEQRKFRSSCSSASVISASK